MSRCVSRVSFFQWLRSTFLGREEPFTDNKYSRAADEAPTSARRCYEVLEGLGQVVVRASDQIVHILT